MPIDLNGACASMMLGAKRGYDPEWTVFKVRAFPKHMTHTISSATPIQGKSVTVDWGDGVEDANTSHTYSIEGEYIVIVKGCRNLQHRQGSQNLVIIVLQCGNNILDASNMFNDSPFLEDINSTFILPNNVGACNFIFAGASNGASKQLLVHPWYDTANSQLTRLEDALHVIRHTMRFSEDFSFPPLAKSLFKFIWATSVEEYPESMVLHSNIETIAQFNNGNSKLRRISSHFFDDMDTSKPNYPRCAFAFNNCSKLVATIPAEKFWARKDNKYTDINAYRDCFKGCVNLTNYKDIPEDWGGPADPLNDKYLCFTAEQDGSLLRLDKSADVPELNARLEYKINAGNWEEYTWGEDEGVTDKKLGHLISLPKVGDTVKWRAKDFNQTFCTGYNKPNYNFTGSGKTSLSGNLASLITHGNPALQRNIPSDNYFRFLFQDNKSLGDVTNLVIDFDIAPMSSLGNLFDSSSITGHLSVNVRQSSLTTFFAMCIRCINLNILSLSTDVLNERDLEQCMDSAKNISSIQVKFTKWGLSTWSWVQYVSPHGTFTCPSDLPVIFGNSNIPHGWTVNNGLTEPSEEEVLNACYRYKNGQLIVQPDFKNCLNRAEQIDYVKHGKTYWKAGTPLPNPHRTDIDAYYKVTSLHQLFRDFSQIKSFDMSIWVLPELKEATQILWMCSSVENIDFSYIDFSNVTTNKLDYAFFQCSEEVQNAYARTQADCDKLNASSGKPTTWEFVVKPPEAK